MEHAEELVRLIRAEFGDAFTIGVAGYPEVHLECWNNETLPPSQLARDADVRSLAAKVRAGADFIISQFLYDTAVFADWMVAVRAAGVKVPVIAGYMPVQAYDSFHKLTSWCRTRIPWSLRVDVERVKDDDAAVAALGVQAGIAHVRGLLDAGAHGAFFHTLNLAATTAAIVGGANLSRAPPSLRSGTPALDFSSAITRHDAILNRTSSPGAAAWTNRAAIKLALEHELETFPNGRYSRAVSPAFGELTDYYLADRRPTVDRRGVWGVPQSVEDVSRVFVAYLDGRVPELPWCDSPPAPETAHLADTLRWLNRRGFLTINSQPRVNGVPSTHPKFGWGGPGGLVYQKAYLEFFCSPAALERLRAALPRYASLSFHALNAAGEELHSSTALRTNAVTWGVFDGREILQPTVIDPTALRIWKDEAFDLWLSQWATIYGDDSSADTVAKRVLTEIHDTWWLVNVVDNDFVSSSSDIFAIFREVITQGMSEPELRLRVRDLEVEVARLRETLRQATETVSSRETELGRAAERANAMDAENLHLRLLLMHAPFSPAAAHSATRAALGPASVPMLATNFSVSSAAGTAGAAAQQFATGMGVQWPVGGSAGAGIGRFAT